MLYIVFEETTARNRDQILDVIAGRRHERRYIVCIAGCRFTVNFFSVCEKGQISVFRRPLCALQYRIFQFVFKVFTLRVNVTLCFTYVVIFRGKVNFAP